MERRIIMFVSCAINKLWAWIWLWQPREQSLLLQICRLKVILIYGLWYFRTQSHTSLLQYWKQHIYHLCGIEAQDINQNMLSSTLCDASSFSIKHRLLEEPTCHLFKDVSYVSSRFITFISPMIGCHYAGRALLAWLYQLYVPSSQMATIKKIHKTAGVTDLR